MDAGKPFERSRPVGKTITGVIVSAGLIFLVISNSDYLDNVKVLNGDLNDLLSNIGFAVLLAAVFQWIFDTKFKEKFFEDIRSEIISTQSLEKSGLVRVWEDSKKADFSDKIKQASIVRIGVTYSDRFIKDYFNCFVERAGSVKLVVYLSNVDLGECKSAIAFNTKQTEDDVMRFSTSLKDYIAALQSKDVEVDVFAMPSMPHYAFVSFDDKYHYVIMSTFSSRRADVPMLECGIGVFHNLLMLDIAEAEACQTRIKAPKQTLLGSLKGTGLTLLETMLAK